MTGERIRYIMLPREHGAWAWWLGPFAMGVCAAKGEITSDCAALAGGIVVLFMLRPPVLFLLRARHQHISREEILLASWLATGWLFIGGILIFLLRHRTDILTFGIIAFPLAILDSIPWFQKRRNLPRDILVALALSTAGPAAYLACNGTNYQVAWFTWGIGSLHSAISILEVFGLFRLRTGENSISGWQALRHNYLPLLINLSITLLAWELVTRGIISPAVAWAFTVSCLHAFYASSYGPARRTVTQIGIRQFCITVVFFILAAWGFLPSTG